jgi:hypothetical protein
MKCKSSLLALGFLAMIQLTPLARSQDSESFDLEHDVRERQERFGKLSTEDQLKIRAAQVAAAADPAVRKAAQKRNQAIQEFRAAMRASMLKADPTIAPILDAINGKQP